MDIKDLENQRNELEKQIKKYWEDKKELVISRNETYVGKCYKRVLENRSTLYAKITSIENENRVNVFEFTNPIDLDDLFMFNDYGFFCNNNQWDYIGNWTEISQEEFKEKMDNNYNRLKEIVKVL